MSGILNMWSLEGDLEQKYTSTHVVSLWYIPKGVEYDNAKVVHVFFDSENTATIFAKKWSTFPQFAEVFTIEDYTKIRKVCTDVYQNV